MSDGITEAFYDAENPSILNATGTWMGGVGDTMGLFTVPNHPPSSYILSQRERLYWYLGANGHHSYEGH
jgi:hypothetical protein